MDPIFEEEGPRSRLALLCNTPGDDIVEIIASGDGRAGSHFVPCRRAAEKRDELAPSKPNAHVPLPCEAILSMMARAQTSGFSRRLAPQSTAGLYEARHTIAYGS